MPRVREPVPQRRARIRPARDRRETDHQIQRGELPDLRAVAIGCIRAHRGHAREPRLRIQPLHRRAGGRRRAGHAGVGRQPAVVEREPQRHIQQERDPRPLRDSGQHRPARERRVQPEADQQEQRDEAERRAGRIAQARAEAVACAGTERDDVDGAGVIDEASANAAIETSMLIASPCERSKVASRLRRRARIEENCPWRRCRDSRHAEPGATPTGRSKVVGRRRCNRRRRIPLHEWAGVASASNLSASGNWRQDAGPESISATVSRHASSSRRNWT